MGIPSGFPILPVLGGSRCAKRPDLPRLRPETIGPGPGPGVLSGDRVLPGDLLFLLGLSFPALLAVQLWEAPWMAGSGMSEQDRQQRELAEVEGRSSWSRLK